jgi:hypothetical protein
MNKSILSVVRDRSRDEFIKSGGSYTKNLQEAQLFGWSPRSKQTLRRYKNEKYWEIIPVTIEVAL